MRVIRCSALIAVAVVMVPSAQLLAQQLLVSDIARFSSVDDLVQESRKTPVLETPLTLEVTNVPLATALDEASRVARIPIVYSKAVLPAGKVVSFSGTNVTLQNVLTRLLSGTGLTTQVTPEGQVVIAQSWTIQKPAQGQITGKVIHAKTKQPLSGITITLGDDKTSVVTGETGEFKLSAPAGAHTLYFRGMGYVRQAKRISVTSDGTVTVTVALEPSASVLDEVIVTGTVVATERRAIPNPITVITAEELEKRGITRIEQLFRGEVPGVVALETGSMSYSGGEDYINSSIAPDMMASANVYVRGASNLPSTSTDYSTSATPLKTYVDGVEILDSKYLGTIDPQSIERIEIITGPQAATIYGSGAMGGVMQIFTKRGESGAMRLSAHLRYGVLESSLNSGKTPTHNHSVRLDGSGGPQFSYSANVSYAYQGQWQPDLFNQRMGGSLGGYHERGPFTANASVSITRSRNGTTLRGDIGSLILLNKMTDGEWRSSSLASEKFTQRVATSSSQITSLTVTYKPHARWQHTVTVGKSQSEFSVAAEAPRYAEPFDSLYRKTGSNGARTTASYNTTISPTSLGIFSTVLTLGANGSSGSQTLAKGCLSVESSTSYIPCSDRSAGAIAVRSTLADKTWGVFGSWRAGILDRFYLTLGLRGERNNAYGMDHKIDWTPTNGATFSIEQGDVTIKFLASYGRATRPPSPTMRDEGWNTSANYIPFNFLIQLPNPHLRPSYSRGPQGGVEVYWGNRGSLTINRYHQKITDIIQHIDVDSVFVILKVGSREFEQWYKQRQYNNVASIRQHGWESTGSINMGAWNVRGTYSWTDSRVLHVNPTGLNAGGFYPGMSFQYVPTHIGNVTINYATNATTASLILNYVGASLQDGSNTITGYAETFSRMRQYLDRRRMPDNQYSSPGYVKSDLVLAHRLRPGISATINVTNLGNSFGTEVSPLHPTIGRQTMFGLSLQYP